MKRVVGAMVGALAGLAFSTMGLIETTDGLSIISLGGNDDTPIVIAVLVVTGAVLGATLLWRFPLAIVGAVIGLFGGIWLRDNATLGTVQPPWVFFLLFGLPAIGAAAGYTMHRRTRMNARYTVGAAALVGLMAALVTYVASSILWEEAAHDPSCDPVSQPDGSVLIPLCPDSGSPIWIPLAAAVVGVAIGMFTRARLHAADDPGSDAMPED